MPVQRPKSQPDLSPSIRRHLYAALTELEAIGVVASEAGVATSTVGRAFRSSSDPEHLVATGGLLLAAFVTCGRMGRLDVLQEVLRRAGLPVRVLPEAEQPLDRATCEDVRDAALGAAAAAGELVGAVRQVTADGALSGAERRELVQARGQLEAVLAELAALVDSAAGVEVAHAR